MSLSFENGWHIRVSERKLLVARIKLCMKRITKEEDNEEED